MTEHRILRMVSTTDLVPRIAGRYEATRRTNEEQRQNWIAEGHEKWGWPLDAECPNCGDTGMWPKSIHRCGCRTGAALDAADRERKEREAEESRWLSFGVPRRFRDLTLATSPHSAAVSAVRSWLEVDPLADGRNLLLFGPVGTGKTCLAVGALRAYHGAGGGQAQFEVVPDMLDRMRPGTDLPDPMEYLQSVRLLVLDDLGVEKPSDWVRERLYVLLNARHGAELPTIVTSNTDLPGLAKQIGERAVSRFAESVTVVKVDGPDLRRVA